MVFIALNIRQTHIRFVVASEEEAQDVMLVLTATFTGLKQANLNN